MVRRPALTPISQGLVQAVEPNVGDQTPCHNQASDDAGWLVCCPFQSDRSRPKRRSTSWQRSFVVLYAHAVAWAPWPSGVSRDRGLIAKYGLRSFF